MNSCGVVGWSRLPACSARLPAASEAARPARSLEGVILIGSARAPNGSFGQAAQSGRLAACATRFLRVHAGKIYHALAAGLLSMSALAAGDLPSASVRVDVQMVSVSTAVALQLVPALADEKTAEKAFAEVQEMLARGDATLLAWPVLWVRSGARAFSESIEEFRYPVPFNPPPDPSRSFKIASVPQEVYPSWGEAVPTSFETRNIGAVLEVQSTVIAEGGTIDLALDAQFGRPVRGRQYVLQRSPLGIQGLMERPEFAESKVTTLLRLRSGLPHLLSVFVMANPEPHLELFIVRATATSAP